MLTENQKKGLDICIQRFRQKEPYTVIAGFAGTGKSYLIKYIIKALAQDGVDPDEDVCYTSYTGKAVQVLQRNGNKNALTLHKLLYKSILIPGGGFIMTPIPVGSIHYKIIVVDEISMVPKDLLNQLLQHGIYLICCGDPFQLPPIYADADNHLLDNPHIFLDKIMRQAAESEIIRLSMDIREGKTIDYSDLNHMSGKECLVIRHEELTCDMLKWADQIICATNQTRQNINNQMREIYGYNKSEPQIGDKVICSRNYWKKSDSGSNALINGTIGYLKSIKKTTFQIPWYYKIKNHNIPILICDIETEIGTIFSSIRCDYKYLTEERLSLSKGIDYSLSRDYKVKNNIPLEFLYGYAITCHRAQGSQWDKVLVIEERFPFKKEEHARWLYTAVTRPASKLVLVR
jgi:exodeoxyribonuclease-5